jgi:hypothetical protein
MDASHTDQINALANRFVGHQKALGLKDAQFATRYEKYLGSTKTWIKLKDGTWPGHVNDERILGKLKQFAELLDGARTFDESQFFKTMPYVVQMNANFERLLASPLDIRGLISLAPQGVGKSFWASDLISSNAREERPASYFYLRLLHSQREKSHQIQCAITNKIGGSKTRNPGDQMTELIKHAQALGEFVLVLDEAHNGGIVLFKLLKDLIDETRMRFVYLGFPTEFDVIVGRSNSAIGESKQTLRRCLQPIHDDYRDGVMVEDVEEYLVANKFKRNKELETVAAQIQPLITSRYNLTTLASAVRDAKKQAEDEETELTLGMVTAAVKALCSTAAERREAMRQAKGAI